MRLNVASAYRHRIQAPRVVTYLGGIRANVWIDLESVLLELAKSLDAEMQIVVVRGRFGGGGGALGDYSQ